jgi:hypothetical protein
MSFEGREEWVPPQRLKVKWSGVVAWQEREDRWNAVTEVSQDTCNEAAYWAAETIFEALGEEGVSRSWDHQGGVLTVSRASPWLSSA